MIRGCRLSVRRSSVMIRGCRLSVQRSSVMIRGCRLSVRRSSVVMRGCRLSVRHSSVMIRGNLSMNATLLPLIITLSSRASPWSERHLEVRHRSRPPLPFSHGVIEISTIVKILAMV